MLSKRGILVNGRDSFFVEKHPEVARKSYAKFQRNSSTGYRGDAIMEKIQDGQWWPYLLTDLNHVWACKIRSLGAHPRQVFKKYEVVLEEMR